MNPSSFQRALAHIDTMIIKCETRIREAENKSIQLEAWLNLYEVNPRLALRNRHLGIIIGSTKSNEI